MSFGEFTGPGVTHALTGADYPDAQRDKSRLIPTKIFSAPFRLFFKKKEDATVTWVEVRSLDGLRRLANRLEPEGDLVEAGRFATLEMQLWGHLAEHAGFLRYQGPATALAAGIVPMGEGGTALVDDLADLFGGDAGAIEAVNDMMQKVSGSSPLHGGGVSTVPVDRDSKPPSALLDESGVTLNDEGVEFLRGMVTPGYEKMSPAAKRVEREAEIAMELVEQSVPSEHPPEPFTDEQLAKLGITNADFVAEPKVLTGSAAAQIGLAVEAARPFADRDEIIKAREQFLGNLHGFVDVEWLQSRLVGTHLTEGSDKLILFIDLDGLSPETVRDTMDSIKLGVKDLEVRLVQPNTPTPPNIDLTKLPDADTKKSD